ncbi:MAG: ABC-2 family transporter protein [Deltaproteobacteria bacterium]|nr:ABC-2 family transporter protein [Deltaproteobacteria bacterium]
MNFLKLPFIFILYWYLWKTLYLRIDSTKLGYSFNELLLYLFDVQWISFCISANISEKISSDIRSGTLSIYLARPVHYLPAQFAGFFGQIIFVLVIGIIPLVCVHWLLSSKIPNPLCFFPVLLGAGVVHFLLEACIGSTSFWMDKVFGLKHLLMTFFNLAGGKLIPISLFPSWFIKISFLSPLRAIYFEPVRTLASQNSITTVSTTIVLQGVWVILLTFILFRIWKKGAVVYDAAQ